MHASADIAVHASTLLRWIPFLPLLGAALNFLLGTRIQKRLGRGWVAAIACILPVASFAIVVAAFLQLAALPEAERMFIDRVLPWLHLGGLEVDIAFQFDPLSAVMALVVTGVGSIIHIYSYGYMDEEPALWRYFALLNLFTFAMLTLVLGDNLLLMFVGWEGVGLCSWALIGFWHGDHTNTSAGNKAFIVNRIGDFGFILGIFLLFWTLESSGGGTLVFREIAARAAELDGATLWGVSVVTLVTLFFFVGATGKSAQIPLHVWLPDAMAGPTPVSALIHAATMVTAGVYMIGRLHFLFSMAPFTMEVVATVGAVTAILAATIALAQNDIKKVLAYSTVSQLGYMFMAMGVGAYAAGIFHLTTHAFFKACLFLGSGSVIHALHHEQDMRKMGGLRKRMPRTFWTFLIATLALAGVSGTAGFFSKDEILWKTWQASHALWALGFAGAALTALYMFRQVFMTFFGECRADEHVKEQIGESSGWMTWPLVVLAAGAVGTGYLGVPAALGGSNRFEQWLGPVFGHGAAHGAAAGAHGAVAGAQGAAAAAHGELAIEYGLMGASVAIVALGIGLAYLIYQRKSLSAESFARVAGGVPYRSILNKYYVDELYHGTVVRGTLVLSRIMRWFDENVIDLLVNGVAATTRLGSWLTGLGDNRVVDGLVNLTADSVHAFGGAVRRVQTGSINAYLYVIVMVVTAVLFVRTW